MHSLGADDLESEENILENQTRTATNNPDSNIPSTPTDGSVTSNDSNIHTVQSPSLDSDFQIDHENTGADRIPPETDIDEAVEQHQRYSSGNEEELIEVESHDEFSADVRNRFVYIPSSLSPQPIHEHNHAQTQTNLFSLLMLSRDTVFRTHAPLFSQENESTSPVASLNLLDRSEEIRNYLDDLLDSFIGNPITTGNSAGFLSGEQGLNETDQGQLANNGPNAFRSHEQHSEQRDTTIVPTIPGRAQAANSSLISNRGPTSSVGPIKETSTTVTRGTQLDDGPSTSQYQGIASILQDPQLRQDLYRLRNSNSEIENQLNENIQSSPPLQQVHQYHRHQIVQNQSGIQDLEDEYIFQQGPSTSSSPENNPRQQQQQQHQQRQLQWHQQLQAQQSQPDTPVIPGRKKRLRPTQSQQSWHHRITEDQPRVPYGPHLPPHGVRLFMTIFNPPLFESRPNPQPFPPIGLFPRDVLQDIRQFNRDPIEQQHAGQDQQQQQRPNDEQQQHEQRQDNRHADGNELNDNSENLENELRSTERVNSILEFFENNASENHQQNPLTPEELYVFFNVETEDEEEDEDTEEDEEDDTIEGVLYGKEVEHNLLSSTDSQDEIVEVTANQSNDNEIS